MDIALTKRRILQRLPYEWLKLVVAIIIVIIFWTGLFQWVFRIKPTEEVILFSSTYNIESAEEAKMADFLSSYGIKKVAYTCYPHNEQNYESILQLKGLGEADLLILSKTELEYLDCTRYFDAIDGYIPSSQEACLQFYNKDEVNYGIMIYQKGGLEYNSNLTFDSWLAFSQNGKEDSYYLVVNKASRNNTNIPKGAGGSISSLAVSFLLQEYGVKL